VKSFEEIMREKQQKRAALITASNTDVAEQSAAAESKQTVAVVTNPTVVRKTKPASPRKYKFTPIVFDLNRKVSETVTIGGTTKQPRRKSLEITVGSGSTGVQQTKRLSIPTAAEATSDSSVTVTDAPVTDLSVTAENSDDQVKSDLTTESAPAATESPSDKSEQRITPVIKRQSSSSSHAPSEGSKKRRTSVDSRYTFNSYSRYEIV